MLIALAAVTLWRGRRLDGSLPRRCGRRALVAVAAAALGFFIVMPVLMGYQFTHLARPQVPEARLGSAYEEVRFETSDGLELEGWYVPSRNGAAVIAFPGRKGPQSRARFLARHGYGVLLFDRRGEGESEGDPNSYGWDGDRDVKAAIAYLQSRSDVDPTASAASGSRSAARCCWRRPPRPPRCGRSCPREQGTARTARCRTSPEPSRSRTSRWPWRSRSTPGTRRRPHLGDLVAKIRQPTLLIHGRNSQGGTERSFNVHYDEVGGANVQRWEITNSGHTGGHEAAPEEYERRVVRFFDAAL